jgi:hypothetical protein
MRIMNMTRIKLFALAGLFLLCAFLMGNVVLAAELDDKTIIATVNGTPIQYSQIKITESFVLKHFKNKHRRSPKTKEEFIRKQEHRSFRIAVHDVLRKEQYRKYDVAVTPEEIDSRIEAKYQSNKKFYEEREQMAIRITEALKAVREEGMDKGEAYIKFLRNKGVYKVDRNTWEAILNMPPEKIAEIVTMLDWNVEDYKKSLRPSITKSILDKRLFWEITEELREEDPDYVASRAKYGREEADNLYGDYYWRGKSRSWWLKRYQEADIDIKVPEFEPALEESIKLYKK